MKHDPEMDALVDALRADLPSDRDAKRVRARLAAVGIGVGTGLASQAAAGSALLAKGGALGAVADFSARVASLSWISKVGLATAVSVSAVAGPLVLSQANEEKNATTNVVTQSPSVQRAPIQPHASPSKLQELPEDSEKAPEPQQELPDLDEERPDARQELPKPPVEPRVPTFLRPNEAVSSTKQARDANPASLHAFDSAQAVPALLPEAQATKSFPDAQELSASFPSANTGQASAAIVPQTTLREETELLDNAFSALRAHDIARAERAIDEHARRFPNGLLARERERARAKLNDARTAERN